jgi:SAM-dependent methyltransferase
MPNVAENLQIWNGAYDWRDSGDDWSAPFGGTEALWWFVLYPRIHRFLSAPAILEIAPGYGRWTQFLRNHCQSLIAVDISEKCIQHCKTRFAADSHLQFHVNDGSSLAAVPDHSIDFVFSFDSLVHVEAKEIAGYLKDLAAKLKPDGVGFLHHSNLGSYPRRLALLRAYERLPVGLRKRLLKKRILEFFLSINSGGWRGTSMTAVLFREQCQQAGLKCITQELLNWFKGNCLIDAISVFTRPGSHWDRESLSLQNTQFVRSAALTSRLAGLYCR